MRTTITRSIAGVAAAALLTLSAACSGGGGDDALMSADSEAGAGVAAPPVAREEAVDAVGGGPESKGSGVNRTVFEVRSVIRTGEVEVTSKDLDAARGRLDALLASVGGSIDSERTSHDDAGGIATSTLVLRVPVDEFDATMDRLEQLGTVRDSRTASKDVTTEVIDVEERVETLQNSLDRLQSYQAQAKDIDDLLRFEQQITQRESELQSLKAQQAFLADQTSMSTISLTLSTPRAYVEPPSALDDAGFLAGLESGWNALRSAVVVVLTVLGAVLPFGVVLLLVGVPTWLLVRRAVRSHALAEATPAPAPNDPPTG
jgi:hypothetical protein